MADTTEARGFAGKLFDNALLKFDGAYESLVADEKAAFNKLILQHWYNPIALVGGLVVFFDYLVTRQKQYVADLSQVAGDAFYETLFDEVLKFFPAEWKTQVVRKDLAVQECFKVIILDGWDAVSFNGNRVEKFALSLGKWKKMMDFLKSPSIPKLFKAMGYSWLKLAVILADFVKVCFTLFAAFALLLILDAFMGRLFKGEAFRPLSQKAKRLKLLQFGLDGREFPVIVRRIPGGSKP